MAAPMAFDTCDAVRAVRAFEYVGTECVPRPSELIVEAVLEIKIAGGASTLVMCTPLMVRELVLGFLFTEGLIEDLSEIEACDISGACREGGDTAIEARVSLSPRALARAGVIPERISYSSCGICGKAGYGAVKSGIPRVRGRTRFSVEVLRSIPGSLDRCQRLYARTGGAHAAMVLDAGGEPLFIGEDMGRHNAVDKVIGSCLLGGVVVSDKILLSSGRASLEMILKAARAGFPLFVAMSRPTSRAVEAAQVLNVTLVDLAQRSHRIYTHARRILGF